MNIELSPLSVLATAAFGLLIAVTLGVVYLTTIEWRDRRWQEQESRETRKSKKRQ